MSDIPSHHYIYGTCTDYISGEKIIDTDDERIRQKLARYMVETKGYAKRQIAVRQKIETLFAGQFVVSKIDLAVRIQNRWIMLIRYGPGSLVTRERPAIAAARVWQQEYQVPLAIVTNGRDAEILDTYTRRLINAGLDKIPSREEAEQLVLDLDFTPLTDQARKERELRILNAFDVEVCCTGGPCALPGAPEG